MSLITSILTGGDNSHETTAEEVNALATDFVSEGVIGAITNTAGVSPATGAFAANEQDTPAMAVDVAAGVAYVTATPTGGSSQVLRVKSTAIEEVTIAANATGSTRYDWIYVKIDPDNAADPAADASDVATLVVSRSTSSSSDDGTPPTYGYPIAVVTVANGENAIEDSMIADVRELAKSVQEGSVENEETNFTAGADASASITLGAGVSVTDSYLTKINNLVILTGFWTKASFSTGDTVLTLPTGYRPITGEIIRASAHGGGADKTARVECADTGIVIIRNTSASTTGAVFSLVFPTA